MPRDNLHDMASNGVKQEEHHRPSVQMVYPVAAASRAAVRKRTSSARTFGTNNCYLRGVKIDIPMLKIIYEFNPWDEGNWKQVVDAMADVGMFTTVRNVKRRVDRLCTAYRNKDMASLNKCGTPQQNKVRSTFIAKVQQLREAANSASISATSNTHAEIPTTDENSTNEEGPSRSLSPIDADALETADSAIESLVSTQRYIPESGDNLTAMNLKLRHELDREKLQIDARLQEKKLDLEKYRLELEEKRLMQEGKRDEIIMAIIETHQAVLKRMDEKYGVCLDPC